MALKVASRGRAVSPFIVMDVMRAAGQREAAGEQVLHLEVGQPGTPAPQRVIDAAKAALDSNLIGYTDARGMASLRQRISRHYQEQYGLSVDPERVMITTGSSGGFLLSFLAAFDPGDRVALAAPGYPAYRNILQALGVEAVLLPSELKHGFQPTVELLARTPGRLDGLIVASPSNPTGTMLEDNELAALANYCAEQDIRFISDEIYHGINYGQKAVSALAYSPDAIIINSFSKYFSMTGWRLGWMILPEDLLRPAECLAQNLFISAPALSQIAGEVAFDCSDVLDSYVATYARNRNLLLEELPKAGFSRMAPADGAFYIYADVSELTDDSEAYCRRMLAETGIAATPGVDFDPARGHHFVRFSFAGPEDDIAEAARRLQSWV